MYFLLSRRDIVAVLTGFVSRDAVALAVWECVP